MREALLDVEANLVAAYDDELFFYRYTYNSQLKQAIRLSDAFPPASDDILLVANRAIKEDDPAEAYILLSVKSAAIKAVNAPGQAFVPTSRSGSTLFAVLHHDFIRHLASQDQISRVVGIFNPEIYKSPPIRSFPELSDSDLICDSAA